MPTPTIPAGNLFMNATLYTGTGATATITNGAAGQAFQPDLVWIKVRSTGYSHRLVDSVRGATKLLYSDLTNAESTDAASLTAFNSNGFSLGSAAGTNDTSQTFVGWQWKAGGTAVTNTSGTISSQVSANTTSGFSVVTYTGAGSTGTIGHGLGVAPSMIIVKPRNVVDNWYCYHASLGNAQAVYLNLTNASGASPSWNSTSPTSTLFTVASNLVTNTNTYVAYCWAPIAGFSQFGSYTGNGSADGPFVYTGFRPKFVMIKRTDSSTNGDWRILDSSRDTYNVSQNALYANLALAEDSSVTVEDFLSNGFKLRTAINGYNGSGATYIYAAFAENPFKYANAR